MDYSSIDFNFGDRRLIGQHQVRELLTRTLRSGRLSHAYLFSGPSGVGKKAFALTLAEAINGIDHLTDFNEQASSRKSSWLHHPDIHLFMPIPSTVSLDEMRERRKLLAKDPYEIIDFSLRPSLDDSQDTKNRKAFYSVDYFRNTIKPAARLKPNEGRRSVIILTDIEKMRKETSNAFLKLLEEPSPDVMFILTTSHPDQLLATISSRCQHLRFSPLTVEDVEKGLIEYDGLEEESARYLSKVSDGNYAKTRFFDTETLQTSRAEIVNYFRNAYGLKAPALVQTAQGWQNSHNREGYITLLDMMELFIRDLLVYERTQNPDRITNIDEMDTIKKFCAKVPDARLEEMLEQITQCRGMIYQNAQPKLVFTALAFRFSFLMRGLDPPISKHQPWQHLPAFIER